MIIKAHFASSIIIVLVCVLLLPSLPYSYDGNTNGLIVLLTDYGQRDYYVGALKGAIYSIYPEARIDDISHHVTPFNIWEGAYTLSLAAKEFPKGTIFVAVVDPGVGTDRKAIVLETKDHKYFVAPDNGLLTFVAEEMGVLNIREIKNRAHMRPTHSSSATFHGRDVFGPIRAHLAAGVPMSALGPEVKSIVRLRVPRAKLENGKILGQVLRVDTFGNVVTNISVLHLKEAGIVQEDILVLSVRKNRFHVRFLRTYGDVPKGRKLCLLESHKLLEIAINMGNLAKTYNIRAGDMVVIHRSDNQ